MARPYISSGAAARASESYSERDVSDIARICLVGVGAVAILAALLNFGASPPVIIATPFVILAGMSWYGIRKASKRNGRRE